MSYNTKQKEKILELISNINKSFTVKDVYLSLNKKVGLTTIYRLVDKLVDDGIISKSIDSNNITYYQYLGHCDEDNHFYLKCTNCEKLIHIDCDCINDLKNHIFKEHNFISNKDNIIIEGLCNKCNKEVKNESNRT